MTEAEVVAKHGTKYHEFSLISNQTRNEIFGYAEYDAKPQEKHKENVKPKLIKPISRKPIKDFFEEENKESKVHIKPEFKESRTFEQPPIIESEQTEDMNQVEPFIETFVRKNDQLENQKNPKVVTSSFGGYEEPDQFEDEDDYETYEKVEKNDTQQSNFQKQNEHYRLPSLDLFSKIERDLNEQPEWLLQQIDTINSTLEQFSVEGQVKGSKKGPTVTRYEIALEPGVNVNRVSRLSDNLMMNLSSKAIRIEAPIPGKPYVGLEVPNVKQEIVAFGNVVNTKAFKDSYDQPLKVALGVDIDGENIYVDIASMPHGLIAGATNSGKSVCVNTILISLLLKNTPEDLKLILIDPKMVELTPYNHLPHLITPVITDAKIAASALSWAVNEMEKRYRLFASSNSRDIKKYNEKVARGLVDNAKMPYLVIIIDELADLIAVTAHDVEDAIQRITQKARAAGIHLLVATQRPSTDVIKGTIKSNIPVRIAFKVSSYVDSTTILDYAGAETLLGRGDMLLKRTDRAHRLQGAYIPDEEIYAVTEFIKDQRGPNYIFGHDELKADSKQRANELDELFEDVARYVVESQNASMNSIQKQFEIGFNRAQRIVEMLEEAGIVSGAQGTKAREVLVTMYELEDILSD
jgi:DNA segregation ATPase FtsK/SpoIIIE, S-DNA-T family